MRYLSRRIIFYAVALWASLTVNFFLPRLMPGDPVGAFITRFRDVIANNPHILDAIRIQLGGSNEPLWQQYFQYLGNTARGDFGVSYSQYPSHVSTILSGGQVLFRGQDISHLPPKELQQFRWLKASIVFQSAMNSLNPVMNLGDQITDAILAHERLSKAQAKERAAELFKLVGIEKRRLQSYPHELSGGMRQRSVIAMALALNPELVIMDEPTTALDVVVQRDILQQIQDLQARFGFSILFITHDLSLLVEFSTRIAIMYAGRIVDLAPARDLFTNPKHPYTVGLMNSFPSISGEKRALQGIPGTPPDLVTPPPGCRFAPRCIHVMAQCTVTYPPLREVAPDHLTACYLYDEGIDPRSGEVVRASR